MFERISLEQIPEDNAITLLNSSQQQRWHWSTMISTVMGFAITINIAVWSYFLASYIGSGGSRPAYFLVGAAISAITVATWRLYTRYLDNNIARLFPEILLFEKKLKVPETMGISGYLAETQKELKKLLFDKKLLPEEKVQSLQILASKKQIGFRGHLKLEILSIIYIFILIVLSGLVLWYVRNSFGLCLYKMGNDLELNYNLILYIACMLIILVSLVLMFVSIFCFQKAPPRGDIFGFLKKNGLHISRPKT